ncbi:MAG: ArsR family transcriptional regulator [Meiothermus sp.]
MAALVGLEPSPTETDFEAGAWAFKALSDPARLKIMVHLAQSRSGSGECCGSAEAGAVCACDLEAITGLSQPTVSHHMKCLVSASLVTAEKRGRWMYYSIDPRGLTLVEGILSGFRR